MDRYNEVKVLLKQWEQEFFKEHRNKPSKEDIDQAPEETRNLYKEYRRLKNAKESSCHDTASRITEHSRDKPEVTTAIKEPECWGKHLNRSAQPTPPARLTSQERESLRASAQYYGLKLKNNLASLSKDRPFSRKKSFLPGRVPLRSRKEVPSSPIGASGTTAAATVNPSSPQHSVAPLVSLDSAAVQPVVPEDQFKPFEPSTEYFIDSSHANCNTGKSGSKSNNSTDNLNVSGLNSSPARASVLPSAHGGVAKGDVAVRGGPEVFRGVRGGGARASSISRLSLIDKKWLERCQVFGEMENEAKPGAGNQEKLQVLRKEEADRGIGNEEDDGGRGAQKTEREELKSEFLGKNAPDRVDRHSQQQPREKANYRQEEAIEPPSGPNTEGGSERRKNASYRQNKGRKRQREGRNEGGDVLEEGGVKKRPRGAKKESCDVSPSPDQAGAKKKRVKKKDGDAKEEKDAKLPTKVPEENLLGEIEEEFKTRRPHPSQAIRARSTKAAEGNFVKINLKKKSHVKGYALRGVGLRKQLYMEKFQLKGERFGGGGRYFGRGRRGGFRGGFSRQGDTCYKCGGTGHWALDCKGPAPPPSVPEDPPADEEPFELPTLEEVARATGTLGPQPIAASTSEEQSDQGNKAGVDPTDEVLLNVIRPDYRRPAPPPPVEPFFDLDDAGNVRGTPAEVYEALRELGYQSFRPGQEEAIMRILSGLSTLVVLSTGMGKSLCYQLPAYMYAKRFKTVTLVVSPLVSLMDDQLSGLPAGLKAACIHSNMTMKQREAAIEKVKSGQVCVLLLSPEALVGGGGSGPGCLPSAQELPPVAFACIDEAHCVSEWSHNFRPCYLRLCKVLRDRLGVRCLLGLTATATLSTALDIARHLDINGQDGIAVRSAAVPPNLHLSVSTDGAKDQALVSLLRGERFGCLDSIIVYCTRREETVRVAALLRTCLQGVLVKGKTQPSECQEENNPVAQRKKDLARKKIRKPLKWQAECYHAGLSAAERRRVQNNFMCGELRIVVATVAFGMGLDKSDVRGIVHYNMPKSFESYVQEIGRAGRDGGSAHCHLFLDPEGGDLHELRRHIYADTVDYYTVKKLVQKVFPACRCKQIRQKGRELVQEIEDSELLEAMDAFDEESRANPAPQEPVTPVPPTAQVTSTAQSKILHVSQDYAGNNCCDLGKLSLKQISAPDDAEEKEETKEEEEELAQLGAEEEGSSSDWPRQRACHTHERAIPIQQTVEALDLAEEGVETLLCYLELHPRRFVELLHPTLSVCKVGCYEGPRQLRRVAKICPPVAVVLARRRMAGERVETCDQLEFDAVEVADAMGWQLPLVKRGLRQLQWSTGQGGGRSGVHVEFSALSFYFRSYGDLSPQELDRVCQFLHRRVQNQEKARLFQLAASFQAFKSVAFRSVESCRDQSDDGRSLQLKSRLSEYFEKRRRGERAAAPEDQEGFDRYKILDWEDQIRADIRSFLSNRSDEKFSGRAVARILHGIGSPCYPAQTYGKDRRYWRKYIQFDFNQLIRLATQEIIGFK